MSGEHESMMGILKLYELRSEQTMRKAVIGLPQVFILKAHKTFWTSWSASIAPIPDGRFVLGHGVRIRPFRSDQ